MEESHASSSPARVAAACTCSLLTHALVALVLLAARRALRGHSRLFASANEVLVTFLWSSWCLEGLLLGTLVSPYLALLVLFLRLLLLPYLTRGAYLCPCAVLDQSWALPWPRLLPLLLSKTALQLLGMAVGVVSSLLTWMVLGSTISELHKHFMALRVSSFLTVSPAVGFALEFGMTFLCFVPRLLMSRGHLLVITKSAVICCLVFLLSGFTGAFMSPIVALSHELACNPASLSPSSHLLVYWLAPMLATAMFVRAERALRPKTHLS